MLERLRTVLIGTSHPGNIGGVARAMHNMGLSDLGLVAPRGEVITHESISRASGADHLLHSARVSPTLDEAVADCTFVVGASARSRTLPWPMLSPRELAHRLPEECRQDNARVALVFGREDSGLTNEELHRCHAHVHIPTNADFSSLNLAAAVQVVAYECRVAWLEQQAAGDKASDASSANDEHLASHADLERYFAHLEQTLTAIEFHDPDKPRQLMARMRRLYLRVRPQQIELNILRGILTATDKAILPPRH